MKILIAAVAAGGLLASANAPSYAGSAMAGPMPGVAQNIGHDDLVHKTGRRGRRIAAGVAIGLGILGIMAASRARAHDDYEYRSRFENRCRRWRRRCLNGNDRACFRFENRC